MLFKQITLLFFFFSTLCFYNTWSMLDDDPLQVITEDDELQVITETKELPKKTFDAQNCIFKVNAGNDFAHLIVNFSLNNIHCTVIKKDNTISQYKTKSFGVVANNIIKHAPIAYKNDSTYTFYIAVKTPQSGIFKKDTFGIKKIDFDTTAEENKEPSVTDLFTHNSLIVHMNIVSQKDNNNEDTNYLVVGSSYPSIKIYDLKKGKLVKTLHNRFLLGCIDNTIVYAKKNTRPITGLGRLMESRKENQSIACSLCYLQNSFEKNNEKEFVDEKNNKIYFQIDLAYYPLIADNNNNMLAFFDTKSNFAYASKKDFALEKYYANIPLVTLKRNSKQTVNKDGFKFALKSLLEDSSLYEYLNSFITIDSYKKYAAENKSDNSTYEFLEHIFTNAIQKIFPQKDVAETIAIRIIQDYEQVLHQNEEKAKGELNKLNVFNLFDSDDYKKIKFYWKEYARIAFQQTDYLAGQIGIELHSTDAFEFANYSFTQIDPISNIYATDNIIFLQQKNNIFGVDILTDMETFTPIPLNLTNDQNIKYIFQNEKNIFILTNTNLGQINLDSWQKQNQKKIAYYQKINESIRQKLEQEKLEQEKLEQEKLEQEKKEKSILNNIIDTIKSNQIIQELKVKFQNTNGFIVNTLNDVQSATRLDGIITDILKNNFIKPIVHKEIENIINAIKTFKDNQKKYLINNLTEQFTDINTWLADIRVQEIYFEIGSNELINRPGTVHLETRNQITTYIEQLNKNKPKVFENTMKRFDSLKSELDTLHKHNKAQYLNKLGTLSYYLALETQAITISESQKGKAINGQTYFAYAKEKIIENAKNIENLKIDINNLHNRIFY